MRAASAALLFSALVLAVAVWMRGARGLRLQLAAGAAAVCAIVASVAAGDWPWQLWLVLVGCAVSCVAIMTVRRQPTWRTAVALTGCTVLSVGLVLGAGAALIALPEVRLMSPSGSAAVGTTVVELIDQSRAEPATLDTNDRRFVVVQAWYPAEADVGDHAWYLGRDQAEAETVAAGLAQVLGVPPFLLSKATEARTSARYDAPPLATDQQFPVVLFSPGLTGVRGQNTGWAQDLASHGYVVIAVDHPHDAAAVIRRDGTVVRTTVASTGDDAADNATVDRLTALRAADLRFVLDEVNRITGTGLAEARSEAGDAGLSRLRGRLDLQRTAVAGHSLGGAAALFAAGHDPRMRAVVDLDGLPRCETTLKHRPPVLALVAGRGSGSASGDERYDQVLGDVLSAAASPSFRVEVPGAAHLSFTDAPSLLPPLPSLVGNAGRTSGVRAASVATRAFLDEVLAAPGPDPTSVTLGEHLGRIGEVTLPEVRDSASRPQRPTCG